VRTLAKYEGEADGQKVARSKMSHFRPIDDVCAVSAFGPIATKLLYYSKARNVSLARIHPRLACGVIRADL
jgi:hypothetical protein